MRACHYLRLLIFTGLFVSAHLSTTGIKDALEREYGDGDYVDPEGPLNIMRGHSCVNNGMIAKQRKYAAPMRLGYGRTGDASISGCAYSRNAHKDEIRKLPVNRDAMAYLSEYYEVLKSLFTVESDVVVVDRSPEAPFRSLFRCEREKCEKLFAALLVLAGGGDLRLNFDCDDSTDDGKIMVSLFINDADRFWYARVLDLDYMDSATLAVVEFFVKYGGEKASQVAGYGLHYTDSLSFLIQAYICEFIRDSDVVVRIFGAAKAIVADLPKGNSDQPGLRFFTKDREYVHTYAARYDALCIVEEAFDGVGRALLAHWQNFSCGNYSDGDDSSCTVAALLKLCYCLCLDPSAEHFDARSLKKPKNELRCALRGFVRSAHSVSEHLRTKGSSSTSRWVDVRESYEFFLRVAGARARTSKTITDCCGRNISAGLTTDPRNFLVVLAWVLGEPEDRLESLQQLLSEALEDAGCDSHCRQISDRVAEILNRFSKETVKAHFGVCEASEGVRRGSLGLSFWSDCDGVTHEYAVKLILKPKRVEVVYVSQQTALMGARRSELVSALAESGIPCEPALSVYAHEELDRRNNFPLCALIRGSIGRCLDPAAHRAISDMYSGAMYAAEDPLACHIALSHWMAHQPMGSLGEAMVAAEQLLPVFEKLFALSADGSDPARCALTADSPVVAVLDNILGSGAAVDDALHELCSSILRHCVKERTDLFPSMFPVADEFPCNMQEMSNSAYDRFLPCVAGYDIPEMLLLHAEQHARDKIQAAGGVQSPWNNDVCAAVARCCRLRYENSFHSLSCDTFDISYYRYSICALVAAAADPAEYHATLRKICGRWSDIFSVFEVYVLMQMAFPKLPKLESISPKLAADVFPSGPEADGLKSLLRIFAVFALSDRDYCGVCEVFHEYRAQLSQEDARAYVELLKNRPNVYSHIARKISDRSSVPVDDVRTPPFYSALKELLIDCLDAKFDATTLLERVQDLPKRTRDTLCCRRD
ncbi:hypothetical protein PAPHI01_0463 [Pancytospora philotis]|nr:hypothetical protein PAPHI01_0463 [Pancytospora philotis]